MSGIDRDPDLTPIPPDEFMTARFMEHLREYIDGYIKIRAFGRSGRAALRAEFGDAYADSSKCNSYIDRIECSPYFIYQFPIALDEVKSSQLWSAKIAAVNLIAIAGDSEVRATTRVAAMKELNVMFGVTFIDENGNTRAIAPFSDFYKDIAERTYPDPGTPEADALRKRMN